MMSKRDRQREDLGRKKTDLGTNMPLKFLLEKPLHLNLCTHKHYLKPIYTGKRISS